MVYQNIKLRAEEFLLNESNFIANAANLSSLIYRGLSDVNWVGFYLISGSELIIGPYQGKPACARIPVGKGICGTVAKTMLPAVADHINDFPGHIICDPEANSEIVLPLVYDDRIYGVLDIDSRTVKRFTNYDLNRIQELVEILMNSSNMDDVRRYYKL